MAVRWEDREGPLLAALAELEDEGGSNEMNAAGRAAQRCEMDWKFAQEGFVRLLDAGYLEGQYRRRADREVHYLFIRGMTERGLVRVGLWPDPNANPLEALLQVLDRMEADEPDQERKGALARIRGAIGSAPRDLSTALLIAAAKHVTHLDG